MKYMMPYTLPIAERGESIRAIYSLTRTRRRYQRRRRSTDGVLLLRRGAPDEVYDALYAF